MIKLYYLPSTFLIHSYFYSEVNYLTVSNYLSTNFLTVINYLSAY